MRVSLAWAGIHPSPGWSCKSFRLFFPPNAALTPRPLFNYRILAPQGHVVLLKASPWDVACPSLQLFPPSPHSATRHPRGLLSSLPARQKGLGCRNPSKCPVLPSHGSCPGCPGPCGSGSRHPNTASEALPGCSAEPTVAFCPASSELLSPHEGLPATFPVGPTDWVRERTSWGEKACARTSLSSDTLISSPVKWRR